MLCYIMLRTVDGDGGEVEHTEDVVGLQADPLPEPCGGEGGAPVPTEGALLLDRDKHVLIGLDPITSDQIRLD